MTIYPLLRWAARLAVQWFYRGVTVVDAERVPRDAPLLLVANHPNALVDALAIGVAVPRRVTLTAKATLFESAVARAFFRLVPIIPLRRASDEAQHSDASPDPGRNRAAFAAILDALAEGGAVLIFPEGKSHSESQLAPLRSGAARLALQARDERGIRELVIVPIGLTFERKWEPRSRVLVVIGEPLPVGAWQGGIDALTSALDARLRDVTLNFPTDADAERVLRLSHTLAGIYDRPRPLGSPDVPMLDALSIARRIEVVRRRLDGRDAALRRRVDELLQRLAAFEHEIVSRDIPINDIRMSLGTLAAVRFLAREGAIVTFAGPLAWWGRVNHWLPLHLAGRFAKRPGGSPEEPAMRTIVAGTGFVLLAYVVQTALVYAVAGGWWAVGYLVSLPPSATWDLRFRDRTRRAMRRMRAYLQMRRNPKLAAWLRAEAAWIGDEARAVEREAVREPTP